MDRKGYEAFYATLPLKSGQFRLVRVWPAETWDDPVTCYMAAVDIEKSPPYNAVSYTWGGQEPEHVVTCNDHKVLVTQSCIDALKGVRHQKLPVVWIDQLCINQVNREERSSQCVAPTTSLYLYKESYSCMTSTPKHTLSTFRSAIGKPSSPKSKFWVESVQVDEQSGQARRTFAYPVPQDNGEITDMVVTGPRSAAHASFGVAAELLKELAAYIFGENHWQRLVPLAAVPTAWKIVADMLNHQYWRRKWIVQEIALGTNIEVMVSQFTVRWESVLGAYIMVNRMFSAVMNPNRDELRFREAAEPYLDLLKDMSKQSTSSLLTIGQAIMALQSRDLSAILLRLARPSTLQTTWTIDSVYSVRALMKDFGHVPPPHYGQDPQKAFVEFSQWFIEHGYDAEILIARTYDGLSLGRQDRPSWSIDWSSQHMTMTKEPFKFFHSYYHGNRNKSPETTRIDAMKAASENVQLVTGFGKVKVSGSSIDIVAEAIPQPEGCQSSITFSQACDFIAQAHARRTDDACSWIGDYLTSSERKEPKFAFMEDHRKLLESLEDILERGTEGHDMDGKQSAESLARY